MSKDDYFEKYYSDEALKQRLEWNQQWREEARAKKITEQKSNGTYKSPEQIKAEHEQFVNQCDIPGAMDDSAALILYIAVMSVGVIFNARWLIWIIATILFFSLSTILPYLILFLHQNIVRRKLQRFLLMTWISWIKPPIMLGNELMIFQ